MKVKRFVCVLLTCIIMLSGSVPIARAEGAPCETIIWLEDLEWEWVDPTKVEHIEADIALQTTDTINYVFLRHSMGTITEPVALNARSTVTFNCSYSPSPANMDFGVIDTSGRFYFINVKEGSINQAIGISQAGTYQVAIRNNSSQTVRVVGFVDY